MTPFVTATSLDPVFREHYARYGVEVTLRMDPLRDTLRLLVIQDNASISDGIDLSVLEDAEQFGEAGLEPIFVAADDAVRKLQSALGVKPGCERLT